MSTDLFGSPLPQGLPFTDVRNTRPSVAEEKAALCLTLGRLCQRVPPTVANGSINLTQAWMAAQKAAMKVAANKRSSAHELQSAISSMERWK